MPSFCAVSTCEQKYSHSENVSFHKFPMRNPKVLAKWIEFTNRGRNWKPSRWNSICSRHFGKSDFREYLSRKCLKRDAIPTITMKNNISYEMYHLVSATESPEDSRTVNSEQQDDYGNGIGHEEGKMESSEIIEICRLCGERADNLTLTCSPSRSLDEPEIELLFRKCLPAVNINGHPDQSRIICTDCVAQLNQYSNFIDKILSYQREFSATEHSDSFATNENGFAPENSTKFSIKSSTPSSNAAVFIKQEPVNVKQEKVDNSNRRAFSVQLPTQSPTLCPNPFADLKKIKGSSVQQDNIRPLKLESNSNNNSSYCSECDRIFGNSFEYRTHNCCSSNGNAEQSTDRETGNNCEIMEIITINNPVSFIDLAEDENATALESRPLKLECYSMDQECKERMEFEHAYAKRVSNCSLKQEIIDSNMDSGESGYVGIENDHQSLQINAYIEDEVNHIHFECPGCNQAFVSQELLDEHTIQMHCPAKTKICALCNVKFQSSVEYLIHKNKVHAQRYQCQQCKRKFNTATILRSHERMCTRASKDFCFSCRHCSKSIRNLAIMRKHLVKCTGKQTESVIGMDPQPKNTSNSNALRLKRITPTEEPDVSKPSNAPEKVAESNDSCNVIDTKVLNPVDKATEDLHVVQSFKFMVDDSKFIFLNDINALPSTQLNDGVLNGKFACDTCGRSFLSFVELKQHKQEVHDSERKFSCSLCPKTFRGISGLKQHISGYHYKIKPHLCPVCNYSYALKGDMLRCRHSKLRTINNFKLI